MPEKMIKTSIVYNPKCFKCEVIKEEMVRVGPIVFCFDCLKEEFGKGKATFSKRGEISSDSEVYKSWMDRYRKDVADRANGLK